MHFSIVYAWDSSETSAQIPDANINSIFGKRSRRSVG